MKDFSDNLNIYVFTTRFVLKQGSPIVYVTHDEDGDWQFLGIENGLKDEDAMIISLGEMIEFDSSIKDIADLPRGKKAVRDDKFGTWRILDR